MSLQWQLQQYQAMANSRRRCRRSERARSQPAHLRQPDRRGGRRRHDTDIQIRPRQRRDERKQRPHGAGLRPGGRNLLVLLLRRHGQSRGRQHLHQRDIYPPTACRPSPLDRARLVQDAPGGDQRDAGHHRGRLLHAAEQSNWGGVDEATQAKYTLDFLVDAYREAVAATYLYQLNDGATRPKRTGRRIRPLQGRRNGKTGRHRHPQHGGDPQRSRRSRLIHPGTLGYTVKISFGMAISF